MAIVPMANAIPGTVALSAEYNKVVSNVVDLDTRLQALEGTTTAAIGRKAGSTRTTDINLSGSTETLLQSVTFTASAGRRYRVTMDYNNVATSTTTYYGIRGRWAAGASVTTAGTQVYYRETAAGAPGDWEAPLVLTFEVTGLPAGQVTIGVFSQRVSGVGTTSYRGSAGQPAYMWVDDVGV